VTGGEYGIKATIDGIAKSLLVVLSIPEDIDCAVKCARQWSCELD